MVDDALTTAKADAVAFGRLAGIPYWDARGSAAAAVAEAAKTTLAKKERRWKPPTINGLNHIGRDTEMVYNNSDQRTYAERKIADGGGGGGGGGGPASAASSAMGHPVDLAAEAASGYAGFPGGSTVKAADADAMYSGYTGDSAAGAASGWAGFPGGSTVKAAEAASGWAGFPGGSTVKAADAAAMYSGYTGDSAAKAATAAAGYAGRLSPTQPPNPRPTSIQIPDIADRVWLNATAARNGKVCGHCQMEFQGSKANPVFRFKACLKKEMPLDHFIHLNCLRRQLRYTTDLASLKCLRCECAVCTVEA